MFLQAVEAKSQLFDPAHSLTSAGSKRFRVEKSITRPLPLMKVAPRVPRITAWVFARLRPCVVSCFVQGTFMVCVLNPALPLCRTFGKCVCGGGGGGGEALEMYNISA